MSAPDDSARERSEAGSDAQQEYGAIVIVGGGCYGAYYMRQLERAARAGALAARELIVVDRDENCQVARGLRPTAGSAIPAIPVIPTRVVVTEWRAYFDRYLSEAAAEPASTSRDAIVPSPLMPHLMGEWLVDRARTRWPDREVAAHPFERVPAVPWERAGADGTHYVSFATWMCPTNCVEPRTCPHTREPRTWSMPERLRDHASEEAVAQHPLVVATLHCRHRTYGVGMFDTNEVIDADKRIALVGEFDAAEVIIGTVSHCHGALTRLVIGPGVSCVGSHVG